MSRCKLEEPKQYVYWWFLLSPRHGHIIKTLTIWQAGQIGIPSG